jgi:opacity protein-like surface antigen
MMCSQPNSCTTIEGEVNMKTGRYHIPITNIITAHIGAGIGLYLNDVDAKLALATSNESETIDTLSASGSCFGFHAAAGADYQLNPNFSIGAEVKWSMANQSFKIAEWSVTNQGRLEKEEAGEEEVNAGGINFSVIGTYMF